MNVLWALVALAAVGAAVFVVRRSRLEAESVKAAARRERERLAGELSEAEGAREDLVDELAKRESAARDMLARLESQVKELESTIGNERSLRTKVEKSRDSDRKWSRQLRAQFSQLHSTRSVLGGHRDIPALVLHTAVTLLGAEKGLLLSREDADHDGKLDLAASEGFANDPDDSAIAQRFATSVLERDETVRESSTEKIQAVADKPSDEEIDSLVAIPIFIQDQFSGVVVCANRPGGFDDADDDVLLALGDHAGAVLQNARLHGDLHNSYLTTVTMLAEAVEAKDPFLRGHSEEIITYVTALADRFKIEPQRREQLIFAAMLHDVGKIGISERILLKPAELTPEERSVVELHPRIGYRIVQQIPVLADVAIGVLHHHERHDGDGYPARLKGEAIPIEARIISVIDAFSAMISNRPYRERMSIDAACSELERCAGQQFDPEVARALVEEIERRETHEVAESALASAMADPELSLRRGADEPILGLGSIAVTDNLTLLYSHRYFHEVTEAEAHRAALQKSPFAVVMAEITDLGDINRSDGYAAGDAAIRKAAQVLQRVAVARDGVASRYSGRRLAILLPHASEIEAQGVASEVESALDDRPALAVGVAVWRPGDTGEMVIAKARSSAAAGGAPLPTRPLG